MGEHPVLMHRTSPPFGRLRAGFLAQSAREKMGHPTMSMTVRGQDGPATAGGDAGATVGVGTAIYAGTTDPVIVDIGHKRKLDLGIEVLADAAGARCVQ